MKNVNILLDSFPKEILERVVNILESNFNQLKLHKSCNNSGLVNKVALIKAEIVVLYRFDIDALNDLLKENPQLKNIGILLLIDYENVYQNPEKLIEFNNIDFIDRNFQKQEFIIRVRGLINCVNTYRKINALDYELTWRDEKIIDLNNNFAELKQMLNKKNELISDSNKKIQTLSKIGKKVIKALTFDEIVEIVYRRINRIMDAPIFGIGRINLKDSNFVDFWGYERKDDKPIRYSVNIDEMNRFSAWCIRNGKKIFIKNLKTEAFNYIENPNENYSGPDIPQSLVYIPLFEDKKVNGFVVAKNYKPDAFSDVHVSLLRNLAIYISIAIKNADMFQKIQTQNENIKASIKYGLTIQNSILPAKDMIDKYHESFIVYKPKDIVSGDFYWFSDKLPGSRTIFSVIDCTGHGVPGAFMSMIANMILNDVVNKTNIYKPSKILEFIDSSLKYILGPNNTYDGMDISMCLFEKRENGEIKLTFSGAKMDIYCYTNQDKKLTELKADRRSIGYIKSRRINNQFTDAEITLNKGDLIYFFTDGIIDQPSPMKKKFGTKRFVELLTQLAPQPLDEQKKAIEKELNQHMQYQDQRDDITIVGMKI
jgi:serine phosphatase RsbU (regulator of sigma subunit)